MPSPPHGSSSKTAATMHLAFKIFFTRALLSSPITICFPSIYHQRRCRPPPTDAATAVAAGSKGLSGPAVSPERLNVIE